MLFPDKHSRELPGSYDNDLHGDRHPKGSNEVCWAADRIHLKLASSVKESYFHLPEHRLKANVLCIKSANGSFISDERLNTESVPYELTASRMSW